MKYALFFLSIFFSCGLMAQTIKLTQLEKGIASGSPVGGLVGVTRVSDGKQRYMTYVNVADNCITFSPKATGNLTNLNNFVQKCSSDSVWYIDFEGRSIFLGKVNTNGGSGTADRDWLEITTRATPDSIGDAIYTYNYAAIGANLKWPNAEFFVNDSASAAVAIAQGNRVAGWSCYNRLNGSWTRFGHDGNVSLITADPTAQKLFIQAAGSGTVDNPGGPFTTRMEIDFASGGVRFNAYPQTRNDAGISTNFLGTDNLGNMVSNPLTDVPVAGGLTGTLGSNVVSDNSIGTDQVVDGSLLPDDLTGFPIGSIGDVLTVGASGVPEWAPAAGGGGGASAPLNEVVFGTGTGITTDSMIQIKDKTYVGSDQNKVLSFGKNLGYGSGRVPGIYINNKYGKGTNPTRRTSQVLMQVEPPVTCSSCLPFSSILLVTNNNTDAPPGISGSPDTTYNIVWKTGFNIDKRFFAARHAAYTSMESNYGNQGQSWYEYHNVLQGGDSTMRGIGNGQRRWFTFIAKNLNSSTLYNASLDMASETFNFNNFFGSDVYQTYANLSRAKYGAVSSLSLYSTTTNAFVFSCDSAQNIHRIFNNSATAQKNTSTFSIDGYNNFSRFRRDGKVIENYLGNVNEHNFGATDLSTSWRFKSSTFDGGQRLSIEGPNATPIPSSRAQFAILNTAASEGLLIGYRTDAKFGFVHNTGGNLPFGIAMGKVTLSRSGASAYPKGNAFFNVFSEQVENKAVVLLQNSVDSTSLFVTANSPEAAITGNPGDITLSNVGIYEKTSGTGNTGWAKVQSGWKGVATLDFPAISAQSFQSLTLTITGASIGDAVQVVDPSILSGSIVWSGKVTAANTITIYASNITSGSLDPASGDFNVIVTKF